MFDVELGGGVVDDAVLVIVVANGAVELVVLEDAIESFALGDVDFGTLADDDHVGGDRGGAGAHEFAVNLDHAGVAALDGAHLEAGSRPAGGAMSPWAAAWRLRTSRSISPACASTARPLTRMVALGVMSSGVLRRDFCTAI